MTSTTYLYVGCYTTESPIGIHVFDASPANGTISLRSTVDHIEHASFLAASADASTLYAVSELGPTGKLVALGISDVDGSLTRLDETSSLGAAPCHVSTDGHRVHTANYVSGTVAAYELRADGRFGERHGHHQHRGTGPHDRQDGPHAHCIVPSPHGSFLYATDLGTDQIVRYRFDPDASTEPLRYIGQTEMKPGSGPRHLAFHPDHPVAFAVCELDNTLVVLDVDRDTGELHPRTAVSTLPADFTGASIAAEVSLHPDGHRVYVSNRGHDSIASFEIGPLDQTPVLLEHVASGGLGPRHFAIAPSGRTMLVANQNSDTIVSFAIDDNGIPRETGVAARVSQPVCLTFVEVGR